MFWTRNIWASIEHLFFLNHLLHLTEQIGFHWSTFSTLGELRRVKAAGKLSGRLV